MLKLTNVFHKNVDAYASKKYRYIVNQGGTSASKTFSLLQILTRLAMMKPLQIDIVGLSIPHLKLGVLNDMPAVMSGFNLNFYDMYNSTDKKIIFPSGGVINFLSFDKLGKAHGGRRDILYINEANHVNFNIAEQLMIRTRDAIFIDYNPTNEFWVHNNLMVYEPEKTIIIKSSYLDNNLLERNIVESLESKRGDGTSNFWRVYGMGELGVAEGLVFDNFEVRDFDIYSFDKYRNGIDWGFSNDPFAFVRLAIEHETLYICQEIYQRGLLNKESHEMVKTIIGHEPVRCDAAEPKSIAEYNSMGVHATPAKKGPGSIESGIKKMQGYTKIVAHPNCTNAIAEFRNYQWRKDKNGAQMPEPVSGMDHLIDAARYALIDELNFKAVKTQTIKKDFRPSGVMC